MRGQTLLRAIVLEVDVEAKDGMEDKMNNTSAPIRQNIFFIVIVGNGLKPFLFFWKGYKPFPTDAIIYPQ